MLFDQLSISRELNLQAALTDFNPALFEVLQQERAHLEQWMDWPKKIDTFSRCERYLREMQLINQAGQQFFSFIFFRQQLAGSIALAKIDRPNRSAELGFWKSKHRLPKGAMHSALQAFITICWQKSQLHRLEIQTPATNIPAKSLSEKLGFVLEGSKREAILIEEQFVDLDIYGLLKNT